MLITISLKSILPINLLYIYNMTIVTKNIQSNRNEQEQIICSKIHQTERELIVKYPILHRSNRNIICSSLIIWTIY